MENFNRSVFLFVFLIFEFFFFTFTSETVSASTLVGLSYPRDYQGNGVRVQNYAGNTRNEVAVQLSNDKNGTTFAEASIVDGDQEVDGFGRSQYNQLQGRIEAEGYDYRWQAGGYYRDQIYFTTSNNQPADLAITLYVHASGYTNPVGSDSAMAHLSLGWNMYYGDGQFDFYTLGYQPLIDLTGLDQTGSYNDYLTLHSGQSTYTPEGYLIASGTYVPFAISVWGTVIDGYLDWANTVSFIEFSAYQNGVQLTADQFTIISGVQVDPVPEPGTLILLGSGIIGVATIRRKKTTQA